MDAGQIAAFAALGLVVLANTAAVAYWGGGIKRGLDDVCRRVGRLESWRNGKR